MVPLRSSSWRAVLSDEFEQPYFHALCQFVDAERNKRTIYPPAEATYSALEQTPFRAVKVVILGQDPYHGEGQACGLSFSVPVGVAPPPSLVNIFKEMESDLAIPRPSHGSLNKWAGQGVLLLNAVLTVRANEANSHRNKGWEKFTDAVVRRLSDRPDPMVFILWGKPAQAKAAMVDSSRHGVILSPHPSPLSARTGFFGSKPFSRANAMLAERCITPIDWRP